MAINNDVTIRTTSVTGAREIKASAHYAYILNGATLDGSKFSIAELVLEGQCLVKDDATGKYEKYADGTGNTGPAILLGANAITPAAVAGLHANTKLAVVVSGTAFELGNAALKALPIAAAAAKPAVLIGGGAINNAAANGAHASTVLTITINGKAYTATNAVLAALAADSTDAVIAAALSTAANADGTTVADVAELTLLGSIIHISTRKAGADQTIAIAGTWGAAGDEALFEGIFGIAFPATAAGAASAAETIATAISSLAVASGLTVADLAMVYVDAAGKLRIVTKDFGTAQTIAITGTWGAVGDEATVEGILGVALPASSVGTGVFPVGKSNPVILDESVKFVVDDLGANPDITVGQCIVHGAVYTGMCIGLTSTFKAALAGAVRFV